MADTDLQQTPYPAKTKRAAGIVGGIHTDATVIGFADKIVVTVVQEGRLAQWVYSRRTLPAVDQGPYANYPATVQRPS